MKLHLILLLASVFNLSSGFRAEVKGPLGKETCTGDEYADFKNCVTQGVATDPNLAGLIDIEDGAIVNRGGERKLNQCLPRKLLGVRSYAKRVYQSPKTTW
jgi:hypothetical protein